MGPLLTAAGLLLLSRIGSDTDWTKDVLPGAILFGLGLVTFVAPLTATVMGSVDSDHVSVGSGVNNAIARTASLAALAVIPVVSGLSAAPGDAEVTHAFRLGLIITACIAALASPVSFFGLGPRIRDRRSARRMFCAVDGPPTQPDPALPGSGLSVIASSGLDEPPDQGAAPLVGGSETGRCASSAFALRSAWRRGPGPATCRSRSGKRPAESTGDTDVTSTPEDPTTQPVTPAPETAPRRRPAPTTGRAEPGHGCRRRRAQRHRRVGRRWDPGSRDRLEGRAAA